MELIRILSHFHSQLCHQFLFPQCLNCRGGWGLTPNCFSNPITHCQIMYWGSAIYYIHVYDLHHNFGRTPTVEKFNPQLIFHNSNTDFLEIPILTENPISMVISNRQYDNLYSKSKMHLNASPL